MLASATLNTDELACAHAGPAALVAALSTLGARVTHPITPRPFLQASMHGREAVVRLLLSRGADATLRNNSGRTALARASTDAIRALLEAPRA
jgi:hypothetical protein